MEITEEGVAVFNNPFEFFELPLDLQEDFLLKSDLNSIKNLCSAAVLSTTPGARMFSEGLCNNYMFWRRKFRQDFTLDYSRVLGGDTLTTDRKKLEYWRGQYKEYLRIAGARMIAAARVGDVKRITYALNLGVDPNIQDAYSYTALAYAAEKGHDMAVRKLLRGGANPNVRVLDIEWTPLIMASAEGHIDVVKSLLEGGADPNLQGSEGITALIQATTERHKGIVLELLAFGANIELQDDDGDTALDEAAKRGYDDIVEILRGVGVK